MSEPHDLLAIAARTIETALDSDRIGTPVAVRLHVAVTADHGQLRPLLAGALEAAERWLAAKISRIFALGGPAVGHVSAHLTCQGGQTGLVSVSLVGGSTPRVELVLVGNQGILSWQPDDAAAARVHASPMAPLSATAEKLLATVDASLERRAAADVGATNAARRSGERSPENDSAAAARTHGKDDGANFKPASPPFGVLLVAGARTHQEMYAQAFLKDKRCRLIGVSDAADIVARRRALNEELAHSLGIPHLANLAEALNRDDVRIVSICAEPERRAPIIIRCAEAGKCLYLDKPLAASAEEGARIEAAVRKAGVLAQMYSMVHTSAAARVRKLVESGAVGDVQAIHCDLFFAKGHGGTARLGMPRREHAHPKHFEGIESKRELYNVGVYPIVFLAWLLGRPVTRVYATTGNYFFDEHQRHDMEDFGQLSLELAGGIVATVSAGRTGWRSHPAGGVNRVCVVGDRGVVAIDAYQPRVEAWTSHEPWQPPPRNPDDPMAFWASTVAGTPLKRAWLTPAETEDDTRHFIDCVERGRASDVPVAAAAAALDVLMAAYESAAAGQPVAVGKHAPS
ncbi:MAG: Gfo/Idh/MocA family oxidoreductase [Planctomycetia bacterium]|nr:Gfo/Idh/MocA family oxidoreductase [Planctomycetia bacterium]